MKIFKYIRYFLFLASNWNIRVAWHITVNDIRGEKKYGIDTTGADKLKQLEKKGIDISHATLYMPASYDLLEDIFSNTQPLDFKHLVDLGCGKGRVLCVAAYFDIKKMTGVDFSKEFCDKAIMNLEKIKKIKPSLSCNIIHNDAFYFQLPDETDCIFLFNPFDELIMSGVIKNIISSLSRNPRKMTIIYLNPLHKNLFLNIGFEEVFHTKKINYLEGSVLKKKKAS